LLRTGKEDVTKVNFMGDLGTKGHQKEEAKERQRRGKNPWCGPTTSDNMVGTNIPTLNETTRRTHRLGDGIKGVESKLANNIGKR